MIGPGRTRVLGVAALAVALSGHAAGGQASLRPSAEGSGASPAAAATIGSTATPAAPLDQLRFEGEYGLFVRHAGDRLEVHWNTAEEGRGRLRAIAAGERFADVETPAALAHVALIARPEADSVVLAYGSGPEGDDWHRTTIFLGAAESAAPAADGVELTGVDSVFVVGDTHGEFDRVRRLFLNAGLVDGELRWLGGRSHLVLLGDIFDRGPDVTRLLWFLYRLEREAAAAGGRVHVVLGNHEIMVMSDDLRYVHGKERLVAQRHGVGYAEMFDPRTSVLGRWLARKPVLLKIDEALLAHGGMSPAFSRYTVQDVQDTLAAYIAADYFGRWEDSTYWAGVPREARPDSMSFVRNWQFFNGPRSIFWYRGYVLRPGLDSLAADSLSRVTAYRLRRMLDRHGAEVHVVGHTAVDAIEEQYDGLLIAVDMKEAGAEMLLLAREPDGSRRRLRYTMDGPPVALVPGREASKQPTPP